MPRLFSALALRLLRTLARVDLLILDDWGLAPLTPDQGHDLLELVDDRHDRRSTLITSQVPVKHWHETIANPTVADAILDRLVHNAHRLQLDGPSMRKLKAAAHLSSPQQVDGEEQSSAEQAAHASPSKPAKGARR
jgi:DNA replication protein DnaC